ncbi:MAG: CerR family C-terminal domain-containing protein [Planctomycetota bacterium]|nr:CerR family C-terminal domain-containing protein [Planctomycetota bacterium]
MKTTTKRVCPTRDELLEAACRVFAAKGFREATIAEICQRAKANIAAVNYHFHDKEALYVEAWRLAFARSLKAHPPDGGVPADAPAARRLGGRIASLIRRAGSGDSIECEIIHNEMAIPTGLLAEVMREAIEPLRLGLADVIRELLGRRAREQDVELCQMSIRSQCLDPMFARRHRREGRELTGGDLEAVIDHVTRFSLAGIACLRHAADARGPKRTKQDLR